MNYDHTQKSPLHWILTAVGMGTAGYAIAQADQPVVLWIMIPVSAMTLFFARCFGCLCVQDRHEFLSVRFGPIPLFGTTIQYDDIERVEAATSDVLDGWGVHWIPGRGYIYNLWGFGCVKITLKSKTVRIGTDDVDGLLQFLNERIADRE